MNYVILYLKKGYALIDEDDFDTITPYKWIIDTSGYVIASRGPGVSRSTRIAMHRVILGLTKSNEIGDHKNHNPRDNRRCNIRKATPAENSRNVTSRGESRYLGVSYQTINYKSTKPNKVFVYKYLKAKIRVNNKLIHLGTFKTEEAAALAYNEAASKYFGEFANLNIL